MDFHSHSWRVRPLVGQRPTVKASAKLPIPTMARCQYLTGPRKGLDQKLGGGVDSKAEGTIADSKGGAEPIFGRVIDDVVFGKVSKEVELRCGMCKGLRIGLEAWRG